MNIPALQTFEQFEQYEDDGMRHEFLKGEHIVQPPLGYLEGSPALAIEIVTDSDVGSRLDLKTEEYFAHGSEEVWIIYPKTRNVRVNYPDGRSKIIAEGELRPDLFAGWPTPVASLFPD